MTERPSLTDELSDWFIEGWAQGLGLAERFPAVAQLAAQYVALRAERAKPTQSDEERVTEWFSRWNEGWTIGQPTPRDRMLAAFASIRAEGSAERAKLEAALKDAAIIARTMPIQTDSSGGYSDGFKDARNYIADRLDDIIRAALPIAQPAESGATEPMPGVHGLNSNYGDCG